MCLLVPVVTLTPLGIESHSFQAAAMFLVTSSSQCCPRTLLLNSR